jgi:hypothetical protein
MSRCRGLYGNYVEGKPQFPMKENPMSKFYLIVLVHILLILGCETIEKNSRMNDFFNYAKAYEFAVRDSKFETAAQFMAAGREKIDFGPYRNIKVINYKVKKVTFSKDQLQAIQMVEIEYYPLNSHRLKTLRENQLWVYNDEKKGWFLNTGLPDFFQARK